MMIGPEEATWTSWERHPAGDEVVVALSGQATPNRPACGASCDQPSRGLAYRGHPRAWLSPVHHSRAGHRAPPTVDEHGTGLAKLGLSDFSAAYADQDEKDYEAFTAAVDSGRLTVRTGLQRPQAWRPHPRADHRQPSSSGHTRTLRCAASWVSRLRKSAHSARPIANAVSI